MSVRRNGLATLVAVIRLAGMGLAGIGLAGIGCLRPPGSSANDHDTARAASNVWQEWGQLHPLTLVASQRVREPQTRALMLNLGGWLANGESQRAEIELRRLANSPDRHWIAVARADLMVLHFSQCLGGVYLRLPAPGEQVKARTIQASAPAKPLSTDIRLEPLLIELDEAVLQNDVALQTQALIARARLTALAQHCPATPAVAQRAREQLATDLSLLASQGHLTPDLAFLWALDRLDAQSPASARPPLLAAREGGYDDPAIDLMLAEIDLELGNLDNALAEAQAAQKAFARRQSPPDLAAAHVILGDVELARGQVAAARTAYEAARKLAPDLPAALLGQANAVRQGQGAAASVALIALGLTHGQSAQALHDNAKARDALATTIDGLLAGVERRPELFEIVHDGLLAGLDTDPSPVRRAHRYLAAATLDARLGEVELARGRAALARDAWRTSGLALELTQIARVEDFLRNLDALEN